MRITWDNQKNEWLKKERNVSFEVICEMIEYDDIIDILENPSPKYPHQGVFVLSMNDYTWFVPFFEAGDEIKLVTAFPSRKAHKKYGGKSNG